MVLWEAVEWAMHWYETMECQMALATKGWAAEEETAPARLGTAVVAVVAPARVVAGLEGALLDATQAERSV